MPSENKLLPGAILTLIYVPRWHHKATLSYDIAHQSRSTVVFRITMRGTNIPGTSIQPFGVSNTSSIWTSAQWLRLNSWIVFSMNKPSEKILKWGMKKYITTRNWCDSIILEAWKNHLNLMKTVRPLSNLIKFNKRSYFISWQDWQHCPKFRF